MKHVSCNLQWISFSSVQNKLQGKIHLVTLTLIIRSIGMVDLVLERKINENFAF